ISFISEFRLQVQNGGSYNYDELDFADRRGQAHKPNSAWLTFRRLAESNGRILVETSDPKRARLEKEIEQIRKNLRKHIGISSGDPLPFIREGTQVGYRAEFQVCCAPSYYR